MKASGKQLRGWALQLALRAFRTDRTWTRGMKGLVILFFSETGCSDDRWRNVQKCINSWQSWESSGHAELLCFRSCPVLRMLVLGKRRPVCSNDVKRIQKEVPKSQSPKWIVYLFPACWVTTRCARCFGTVLQP